MKLNEMSKDDERKGKIAKSSENQEFQSI